MGWWRDDWTRCVVDCSETARFDEVKSKESRTGPGTWGEASGKKWEVEKVGAGAPGRE